MVYHRLDIHLPDTGNPPYPAVVVIYGSAFFGNNLKGAAFQVMGEPLLKGGFAVIPVNHRSSRDALFPAQVHDIKAAVRYIRANGSRFGIDTTFIGITGYSSGGHLAAFTGTSGSVDIMSVNSRTLDIEGDVGAFDTFDSSVDAVVDWFGPTDFLKMDSCGSSMVHDAADSPESSLLGGPVQENRDLCALANPATYADATDPPFLILHGDADPLVPHCQSEALYQTLQDAGVPSRFILVPGAGHGRGLFQEKYFGEMTRFFQEEFSKK